MESPLEIYEAHLQKIQDVCEDPWFATQLKIVRDAEVTAREISGSCLRLVLDIAKKKWKPTCPFGVLDLAEEGNRVLWRTIKSFPGNTAQEFLAELTRQVEERLTIVVEHPDILGLPMSSNEDYALLIAGIQCRGGFTTFRNSELVGGNLVCASRRNEDGSLGGNSFWIWFCQKSKTWLLSTWSPYHYLVPSSADVVDLCMECLWVSGSPLRSLPATIIAKFKLTEISEEEFESLGKEDEELQ